MAKLKSYSCPKCGSFLDVDRDQDKFDCPFCGSQFNAVDFHGNDLREQAKTVLKKGDYKSARQKYEYLLNKTPEDFEVLYGYACAVGEVSSLDKFEDPKRYSQKLRNIFLNDPRYSMGPAAPYFAKLAEMFEISRRRTELSAEYNKLLKRADEGIRNNGPKNGAFGCGFTFFAVIYYVFGLTAIWRLIEKNGWVVVLFLFLPVIVFVIGSLINKSREEKNAPEIERRRKPYYDMKTQANEIKKEVDALDESYNRAFKSLPKLKETAGVEEVKDAKAEEPDSTKRPVTDIPYRSPFTQRETDDVPADLKKEKAIICKKCGAELRQDKVRKLYVCDHCGVSYDYDLFVGDPTTKAMTLLRNGDFESADKWFSKILAYEPDNFEANRGRILCAGKWIGFIQLKLNDKLAAVDWESLDCRINEAVSNTEQFEKNYFAEAKDITGTAHEYYETCLKMEGDGQNSDLLDLLNKKESLITEFNDKYRKFIDNERKLRARQATRPDNMISFRMLIITSGMWESINRISPDEPFVMGRIQVVRNAISEAISNSNGEYNEYFKLWDQFINEYDAYSKLRKSVKDLKARLEELKNKPGDAENQDKLNDLNSKIRQSEYQEHTLSSSFNETYNKLIRMDNKLFYEKTDSIT